MQKFEQAKNFKSVEAKNANYNGSDTSKNRVLQKIEFYFLK